jgi:hypothetical protein
VDNGMTTPLVMESEQFRIVATVNGRTRCNVFLYHRANMDTPLLVEDLNLAASDHRAAAIERLDEGIRPEATVLFAQLAARVAQERAKPKKEPAAATELFPPLEPWDHAVDGVTLADALLALIVTYVSLPRHAANALALWLLHTYVTDVTDYTPYILVTSPVRECGKSTLLDVLLHLAYRAIKSDGITAAALYRLIEKNSPAMLLDEMDTRLKLDGGEALRGVLNAGFQRSGQITICVGDEHEARHFRVFCPKVLAGIGRPWDTVVSRSIPVRLTRASREELAVLQKVRGDRIDGICLPHRRRALRWATDNRDALTDRDPAMPAELGARQCDVWRPLMAISDLIGGHWPETARAAAVALHGVAEEEGDYGLLMLEDVRQLFATDGGDKMFSATIAQELGKREDRPWPEYRHDKAITARGIASLLGRFGVKPKTVRVRHETGKGYDLADLAPAFRTYLIPPQQNVTSVTSETDLSEEATAKPEAPANVTDVTEQMGDAWEPEPPMGVTRTPVLLPAKLSVVNR